MPYIGSYAWTIRQKIGNEPLLIPSAEAIAIDENDRLLMVYNKDWDMWLFPSGYAEIGQTSQDCAVRELLEEGGLKASPESMTPIAFVSGYRAKYANGDIVYPFTQIFITKDWQDTLSNLDESEVSGRKWMTVTQIKESSSDDYLLAVVDAYEKFLKTNQYQLISLSAQAGDNI